MSYLLIALVNLVYIPTIWYGLISDDATTMKVDPYPFRRRKIGSVILHTTVSCYIYYAFGQTPQALIAAILFSLHPMAVQGPVWVSADHYPLMALLFLAILAFGPWASPLYFFSPSMGVGQLIFTPLCFLFTQKWYLVFYLPVLAWLSYKWVKGNVVGKIHNTGTFTPVLSKDFSLHKFKWINLIIVVKTFGYYSLACLLPIKNGFYNSFLVTIGSSKKATDYWYSLNRHFWGGIFSMVLMAVVWWFNKSNPIGMGIILFATSLAPFLNFITVQQHTTSRYAYCALIGFQVALVGLLFKLPSVFYLPILGALFIFYLDRLLKVLPHYAKDNLTMIELESRIFPDNPRVWYFKYEHMLHKNNPVMAWAEAIYGLRYLPEDCQLWFGLACASFQLGDLNAAKKFLETSERFMILHERTQMQGLVNEFRQRIQEKLAEKWGRG
jgi:hypothetical protein